MNIAKTLNDYGFSPAYIEAVAKSGIKDFYPPQAAAIDKGVLEGNSVLLAVPTASGKTFVAELCMARSILEQGGRCLYIAPLKALASEKYEEFKERFTPLGVKVGIATGDLDSPTRFLNRYQILIATAEKVDSLIRSRAKWLINSLNVVVLDEIHFINDGSRGPTMEILTARIKQMNPDIQILALSATVKNATEMAGWLKAKPVVNQWRPVPLKEGVYYNEKILFNTGPGRMITEDPPDDVSKLVLDTMRAKGQALVFVNSRRSAQAVSRQVARFVASLLSSEEKRQLADIAKSVLGSKGEATKICRKLAESVVCGAAFHHAGLRPRQRKLIEDAFRKNLIKVICSTPTLAAGVNLPARRVIIRDCKRYEAGLGSAYIPVFEYKQCAGRAGRPKYDDHGEAVLVAKSFSETSTLFEKYINAQPEPVMSKLGNEAALRIHVLASIAGGYVHDINGMFEFITHTFLAHQKRTGNLIELISHIFDFLEREGFIEKSGFRYFATTFGQCISRLYIDPLSGLILRGGLKKVAAGAPSGEVGLLHLMCCCPDSDLLHLGKSDYEELEGFASAHHDQFIMTENDIPAFEDYYFYMMTLKTTDMLCAWINEQKEDVMCEKFNIGPGDIHRHTESVQWLLHAASVIAELLEHRGLTFAVEDLRQRVKYGIREELLELASLKGVGRVRARQLFKKGYRRLSDLKFVDEAELAAVPQVGKSLAKEIIKQVAKFSRKDSAGRV